MTVTCISLSSDKKYLEVHIYTEYVLKIRLDGDIIVTVHEDKLEYEIAESRCKITHETTRPEGWIREMNIEGDTFSYKTNYEDNSLEEILANVVNTYKESRL